jgi:hypothetical protein
LVPAVDLKAGAADRIIDRGAEHRRGARLVRVVLHVHAELVQDLARVAQHVHDVRDGRALVAADVRDAGLQQRFRDGEDAFAVKGVALAELEQLHFLLE